MRLFSNSTGLQVPYAPIFQFDRRLLLGMSLFSKKYGILPVKLGCHAHLMVARHSGYHGNSLSLTYKEKMGKKYERAQLSEHNRWAI